MEGEILFMNEEIFGTPDHQPEGEGTAPIPQKKDLFLEKKQSGGIPFVRK